MPKFTITFQPTGKSFKSFEHETVLSLSQRVGIKIPSICNGEKLCGKCAIKISNCTKDPTEIERKYFSDIDLEIGFRLACKTIIDKDLIVWIFNEDEFDSMQILSTGVEYPIKIESNVLKIDLEVQKPSLENNYSFTEAILNSLSPHQFIKENFSFEFDILQNIPKFLNETDFNISSYFIGSDLVDIKSRNNNSPFGIAIDLGTTTIVALLIDLISGETKAVSSRTNPQIAFGADVITRINHCINNQNGLIKLQTTVIDAINEVILELCKDHKIDPSDIFELALAGNTTMNHIFLGVDPKGIAFSPYLPVYKERISVKAGILNIDINRNGCIYTLPNISGFVGGDITGLILAHNLLQSDKIILALDLGTNGEIVLGSKKRLLTCATAAGPAFEGGHISNGMRSTNGAIDKFSIYDKKFHYHVVGNVDPIGICGTGLLDIIAELIKNNIIDETGRILSKNDVPNFAKENIIEDGTKNSVSIFKNDNNNIILTQQDVRELQLAKGAIRAGISVLLTELGITENDIDEVLIAGAFGSYINKESAVQVGLIPKIDLNKIKSIGNSASIGAKQFLISNTKRKETDEIIKNTEYIELCLRPDFQNKFMEEMLF